MSQTWVVVATVGLATVAIKAMGPVLLGGRPLHARVGPVIALLAPALLSALVAINTIGSGERLTIDARLLGLAAAAVALRFRAPVLLVVVLAATVTAVVRAVAG